MRGLVSVGVAGSGRRRARGGGKKVKALGGVYSRGPDWGACVVADGLLAFFKA